MFIVTMCHILIKEVFEMKNRTRFVFNLLLIACTIFGLAFLALLVATIVLAFSSSSNAILLFFSALMCAVLYVITAMILYSYIKREEIEED